jgi:AbrB family looped-hinge helix DNA binding protein
VSVPQSKITSQGQISVPAEIRRKLGVGPGSVLEWEEDGDRVVVRRVGRFTSEDIHDAAFGDRGPAKARTPKEMDAEIARHLKAKHARR